VRRKPFSPNRGPILPADTWPVPIFLVSFAADLTLRPATAANYRLSRFERMERSGRGPTVERSLVEETFLDDDFLRQLMSVGEVDLLVGIPSHNNASTIGQTLQTVEESLRQNFVRERVAILNMDGGSGDETRQIFERRSERREPSHKGLTSLRT